MCRSMITRRIVLRRLNKVDPELEKNLRENFSVCKECMSKAPDPLLVRLKDPALNVPVDLSDPDSWPKVPTGPPKDCRACDGAVKRMNSGLGRLGSDMSHACDEISNCKTCACDGDSLICSDRRKVLILLSKWKKDCGV